MFFFHPSGKIAGVFSVCISLAVLSFAQTPPPADPISPADLQIAKQTAQSFCAYWKALTFDSMYVVMSEKTQAGMSKEKLISTYAVLPDSSGKLSSFTLKESIPNDDGIAVKAELAFARQKPPTAVNGGYSFHLVKEAGLWNVKAVVPPIAVPVVGGSGGSNPGE